jgi:hypothetical protein
MVTPSKVQGQTAWKELSEEANADRRREKRINLAFPIELFGFNSDSHYFTERSVTVNVSRSGCQFRLKNQLDEKTVVAIRLTPPENIRSNQAKPTLFLISWVKRAGDKWAVGASTLQPEDIWPIAVPDKVAAKQESSKRSSPGRS